MATLYCGPSNTGNGSGSNFSNLLELPNTTGFTRDNTYIIVDGSYGARTFSTATSDTTTITIRKASAANSAVAGYSSSLHDGAATFSSIFVVTRYWVLDGVTRTETNVMEAPAGYGIRVTGSIEANSNNGDDADFSSFSYLDVGGTWSTESTPTCANTNGSCLYFVYNQANLTFTSCCFHNRGSSNSALAMMHGSSDITWDHCDFYMGWGKAGIASPNVSCYRWTVKFCRFWDSARGEGTGCGGSGTGLTCDFGSYGNDLDPSGHIIYGSIFYSSAVGGGRNSCFQFGGSGFTNSTANNCKAFNNTFVGIPEDPTQGHISFNGAQTGGGGPGTGNEARNNLWWDCVGVASVVANSSSNNVDATVNPFIAGGYPTTLDFRISSTGQARNAGTDVGSPYNVDPLGVTRSAGSWDVGAYEYDAGGSAPNAPTNLRLV